MNDVSGSNMLENIVEDIVNLVNTSKEDLVSSVNKVMTETYWRIGK